MFELKSRSASVFRTSVVLGAALLLSGCSTLSSLNPFGGGEGADQGELPEDARRIPILELSDSLTIANPGAPNVVLPPAYVNTDWPQAGGNVQHVVQHTGASGSLVKVWSKDVGDGSGRKGFVAAAPIIANGVIYVFDADNTVRAFNEADGASIWSYKLEKAAAASTRTQGTSIIDRVRDPASFLDGSAADKNGVGGGVAYDGGIIYVSSGLGLVAAIDGQTGEPIWVKSSIVPMHSAPVVADGRVFAITDDNEIFAYSAADGEVLWTYQGIVETARMLTVPAPAVVGDTVIVPFSSGELLALRVQNGGVLWQDSLSSSARLTPLASLNDIAFGPVIADGYVIASAQSGVTSAFDLRTGQRIWSQPAGTLSMPWVAGDVVFVATTDGKVAAMSKLDGSVQWIQQLQTYRKPKDRKDRVVWSGPILAGQRLVTVSSAGRMVVMNPMDGSIIEERKLGGSFMVQPVIANETIYLLDTDAKLTALR